MQLQMVTPENLQGEWLSPLLEAQAPDRKLPGSAAAVVGAAAGIASLSGTPGLLPGIPLGGGGSGCSEPGVRHAVLRVLSLTPISMLISYYGNLK